MPDLTVPKSARSVNASESDPIDSYNAITTYPNKEAVDNDLDDNGTDGGYHEGGGDGEDGSTSSPLERALMKTIAEKLVINPKKLNEQGEELYCYCNRVSFGDVSPCSPKISFTLTALPTADDRV